MIKLKDLGYIIIAIICCILSYLMVPLSEQYQGATGYVYEYGMGFAILHIVLLVLAFVLTAKVIIDNYEVYNGRES